MTIYILLIGIMATFGCIIAPKKAHRAICVAILAVSVYFVCSYIMGEILKAFGTSFMQQHTRPTKVLLRGVRADLVDGNTNAALTKLDTAIELWDALWVFKTNFTVRTINEKLGIRAQAESTVPVKAAPSAPCPVR